IAGRGKLAARSDLIRYELVARMGGVYMDTDVRCLGNIDRLMVGVRLFVCDEGRPPRACVGNYGFGATPNHPAMWTVVRELWPRICDIWGDDEERPAKFPSIVKICGPAYLNEQLR